MKILICGAGVIGSIFGAKLSLSGQDVFVLARGGRLYEIKKDGILIGSPKSQTPEAARVQVIEKLKPHMKFDYILVTMQNTQVDAVLDDLSKNCSENIIFVVNTAGGYQKWEAAVGRSRLMIGFPSAGGQRKNGVVTYFVGKGLMRAFQTTTFGEPSGQKTRRVLKIIELCSRAGIPSVFCGDMDAWQKTHVAMVTCIANALYAHGCDGKKLAAAPGDVREMVLGVKEGFGVLKKLGISPTPRKLSFFKLPSPLLAFVFGLFFKTKLADVTMAKHCAAAKSEMLALQREFDRLIEKSGLKTPAIDALRLKLLNSGDNQSPAPNITA